MKIPYLSKIVLTDRDRKIILIAGAALALILLVFFVFLPAVGKKTHGMGEIEKKEQELQQMVRMYKDFLNVKTDFDKMERQINEQGNFALLSRIEDVAKRTNVKIDSMESKPQPKNDFYKQDVVDVHFRKVILPDMISFVYEIENDQKILRIKKMHVETNYSNPDLMDVRMEISTFARL